MCLNPSALTPCKYRIILVLEKKQNICVHLHWIMWSWYIKWSLVTEIAGSLVNHARSIGRCWRVDRGHRGHGDVGRGMHDRGRVGDDHVTPLGLDRKEDRGEEQQAEAKAAAHDGDGDQGPGPRRELAGAALVADLATTVAVVVVEIALIVVLAAPQAARLAAPDGRAELDVIIVVIGLVGLRHAVEAVGLGGRLCPLLRQPARQEILVVLGIGGERHDEEEGGTQGEHWSD